MEESEQITGHASESEDELEKLTRQFEEQASKDLQQAVQRKQKETTRVKAQKSMKEVREEGLQAPLSEQSKGFKMLAKMGYQKGRGLGKDQQGSAEPIGLAIRGKRAGLGVEEERKRKREEAERAQVYREKKRQQIGAVMQKGFAAQQAAKLADRRYEGQLSSARKVIETLDRRKGLEQSFLWPPPEPEEADDPQPDEQPAAEPSWEDQPVKDKLITALTYLRNHHNYCLHCGCQYDSQEDMQLSCPGLMDEDH